MLKLPCDAMWQEIIRSVLVCRIENKQNLITADLNKVRYVGRFSSHPTVYHLLTIEEYDGLQCKFARINRSVSVYRSDI